MPAAQLPAVVALDDGAQCVFAGAGATLAFGGQRLNYTCPVDGKEQVGILGDLQSGDVWTAEKVILGRYDDGFFVKTSEMVAVHIIQQ